MANKERYNQQKTPLLKNEEINRQWFIFDAAGKTLGRLASEITKVLRGKHRANYTPHVDCGDSVIVVNAEKVRVTGRKEAQKTYRYYTGFVGGEREIPYQTLLARKPGYIIERAVKGMMPGTRQASHQLRRLRIFAGTEHGMDAQKPIQVNI